MAVILKKNKTRLRVKCVELPMQASPLLGTGVDVMQLPEGHLACPMCQHFKFEVWVYLDNHRLEVGCMKCGHPFRLHFPLDIDLGSFGKTGRFTCKRHPEEGFIIIHNVDVLSIGCAKSSGCLTDLHIKLQTKSGLVLADA